MKLSEIINIEYQLYTDARSDPAMVRNRNREIGKTYDGPEDDRVSLFRFWLKRMEDKYSYPGQSVDSALTFLRYLIFFFFLISGATSCAGLLAYDYALGLLILLIFWLSLSGLKSCSISFFS